MRRDQTKEEDYKKVIEIIRDTPDRDTGYYISKIAFMLGLSDDKADEMFWLLDSARIIGVDENGKVVIKG